VTRAYGMGHSRRFACSTEDGKAGTAAPGHRGGVALRFVKREAGVYEVEIAESLRFRKVQRPFQ
jgi:hypothetical protein